MIRLGTRGTKLLPILALDLVPCNPVCFLGFSAGVPARIDSLVQSPCDVAFAAKASTACCLCLDMNTQFCIVRATFAGSSTTIKAIQPLSRWNVCYVDGCRCVHVRSGGEPGAKHLTLLHPLHLLAESSDSRVNSPLQQFSISSKSGTAAYGASRTTTSPGWKNRVATTPLPWPSMVLIFTPSTGGWDIRLLTSSRGDDVNMLHWSTYSREGRLRASSQAGSRLHLLTIQPQTNFDHGLVNRSHMCCGYQGSQVVMCPKTVFRISKLISR